MSSGERTMLVGYMMGVGVASFGGLLYLWTGNHVVLVGPALGGFFGIWFSVILSD